MYCLDDKAVIPVGEYNNPVSTGVRGHNRVLAPCGPDAPILTASDHDYHVSGIIPSVALATKIPKEHSESFFNGQIHVTLKEKVFQPSSPVRHACELMDIILDKEETEDEINILILYSDGGPDHRPTFETVKLSYLILFLEFDLDMLAAFRTAPMHSWMNPAERVMSLLNLALQHCSLQRGDMQDWEGSMKNKTSMAAIRNASTVAPPAFETAYIDPMQGPLSTVHGRMQRMKLKEKNVKTHAAAKEEDLKHFVQIANATILKDSPVEADMASAELKKKQGSTSILKKAQQVH